MGAITTEAVSWKTPFSRPRTPLRMLHPHHATSLWCLPVQSVASRMWLKPIGVDFPPLIALNMVRRPCQFWWVGRYLPLPTWWQLRSQRLGLVDWLIGWPVMMFSFFHVSISLGCEGCWRWSYFNDVDCAWLWRFLGALTLTGGVSRKPSWPLGFGMIVPFPKDRSTAFSDQCSNATGTPGVTPRGTAPLTTTIQGTWCSKHSEMAFLRCFRSFHYEASHKSLHTKWIYTIEIEDPHPQIKEPDVHLSILGLVFPWGVWMNTVQVAF